MSDRMRGCESEQSWDAGARPSGAYEIALVRIYDDGPTRVEMLNAPAQSDGASARLGTSVMFRLEFAGDIFSWPRQSSKMCLCIDVFTLHYFPLA